MRRGFDAQLQELNTELIEMGALIEHAIQSSVESLVEQDAQKARRAIAFDREVDQKEKDIEALCLKLLLQQQPVARDLRLISAALKMITDMERIGDQSADISEIVIFLSDTPYIKPLDLLPKMADATMGMVTRSIDAFVRRDLEMAQGVIQADDVVDGLFSAVREELTGLIREDPANGSQALDFLMIAKYFERIGDHAVNIAEWVVYAITGVHRTAEENKEDV